MLQHILKKSKKNKKTILKKNGLVEDIGIEPTTFRLPV